jgi:carbamoyl-phosphate synthase small subunit
VVSERAMLVLADGSSFVGSLAGAPPPGGVATGEIVFNTAMSGYQEIITDPSYAGQMIAFTCTHIGNYGVNPSDDESRGPFCRGVVVRDLARRPSSWRAAESLDSFLARRGVPAITGVDTRRLTRTIRQHGSLPSAFGAAPYERLLQAARQEPGTEGKDLASEVSTPTSYHRSGGPLSVVAFDFGIKTSILAQLSTIASVTVVPAWTAADDVLATKPDGVFLSNGPGDPAALEGPVSVVRRLLGKVPIFGICLGHQVLSLALGAKTYKLSFGHHGANHPVRNLARKAVEITSQNHNYAVGSDLPGNLAVTHVNLNDDVIEGISCTDAPAFGVQYHPEAGPGPHDARYLFEEFRKLMEGSADPAGAVGR